VVLASLLASSLAQDSTFTNWNPKWSPVGRFRVIFDQGKCLTIMTILVHSLCISGKRPLRSILTLMVLGAGNVAVPLSLHLPAFTLIRRDVTKPCMSSWEGTDRDL
jgi:hypothetical protein